MEMVVSDWEPTENYLTCQARYKTKEGVEDHEGLASHDAG